MNQGTMYSTLKDCYWQRKAPPVERSGKLRLLRRRLKSGIWHEPWDSPWLSRGRLPVQRKRFRLAAEREWELEDDNDY